MRALVLASRLLLAALLLLSPRWSAGGRGALQGASQPSQPSAIVPQRRWEGPGRALAQSFDTAAAADAASARPPLRDGGANPAGPDKHETIAQVLGEALKEEFHEDEEKQAESEGKIFNETARTAEAKPETVLLISQKKLGNHSEGEVGAAGGGGGAAGGAGGEAGKGEGAEGGEKPKLELAAETQVDRIIDSHDNEYVLSKPNEEGSMGLNLDPQFVRDLTILIGASAAAGLVMEALGQPTINGYFIAGSLVGPGGLQLVKELVQVQSMAQLGVQLLLFSLGLEFSLSKLKAMRNVAMLGGLLQIVLLSALSSVGALFIGAPLFQGAFLGALVAMSSTSIVVKCLNDARVQGAPAGQITIATLVLQDCVVGLLFALMPVLAAVSEGGQVSASALAFVLGQLALVLAGTVGAAALVARAVLPRAARLLARHSSSETYQLSAVAFCLMTALATTKLGISPELGAFIAGVMLGATDQQEYMLQHLEPITHFFVALFVSSIGLILSPAFLLHHMPVLAAGVSVVVIAKAALIGGVVWLFRYPADIALSVGINLAQIGEFGFILLSMANQLNLIPTQVYMLLMGVTALSLLITPFLLQASARITPGKSRLSGAGGSAASLELQGLKRQMSAGSSGSPVPGLPLGDAGADVQLKLQSATGQELGYREEEVYSPMDHIAGGTAAAKASNDAPRSPAAARGIPAGIQPLPGETGYGVGGQRQPPLAAALPPQQSQQQAARPASAARLPGAGHARAGSSGGNGSGGARGKPSQA